MKDQLIIQEAIAAGESEMVEFLTRANFVAIGRVICSFLNNNGGQLIIGVDDNKKVVGVSDADKTASDLQNYLIKELVPEAPVSVSREVFDNREIITVKVWKGSNKPYIFGGSIYYRRGSATVKATSKELSDLIRSRQQEDDKWERQLALNLDIEDIDFDEIKATIDGATSSGRSKQREIGSIVDPLNFLEYYGLYQNGNFTNAATILFAKQPAKFIPQCSVRIAVFTSSKTGPHYAYDRTFEGNIFKNVLAIEDFFDVNIGTSSRFKSNSWKRSDKLNYPKDALREAILNAVLHRDYSNLSGSVLVSFYPDRLEISSYGPLPKELTVASLKHTHLSLPVNPDVAQMVYLRGWIEKIGRGTIRILEQCKEYGLKPPIWSVRDNVTTITFYGISIVSRQGTRSGRSPENNPDGGLFDVVNEGVNKGVNEGVIAGVNTGVKKQLVKVLAAVEKQPGQSSPEIAKAMRKTQSSTERYIRLLRAIQLIEFIGAPKTGGYFVKGKEKKK